jgi:hypothetical protein
VPNGAGRGAGADIEAWRDATGSARPWRVVVYPIRAV